MTEIFKYDVQVVGNGPAALGLPLRELEHDSNTKLCLIGPRRDFGEGNLCYNIEANSAAKDFIEVLPSSIRVAVEEALGCDNHLFRFSEDCHSLEAVSELLRAIGEALQDAYQVRQEVPFTLDRHVAYLRQTGRNEVTSYDSLGEPLVTSQDAVISIGARQKPLNLGQNQPKLELSDEILRLFDEALDERFSDKKVVILGGAHSAFSVADNLHEFAQPEWVKILHRSPVKPYFATESAAEASGYVFEPCQLDEGKVNRFDGIRGRAKDFYEQLSSAEGVSGFSLLQYEGELNAETCLDEADVIIQATGYTPRTIPIFDRHGRSVEPNPIDTKERFSGLKLEKSQIFYNGLAVTPRDGVNLFQSAFANRILLRIREPLSETEAAIRHIVTHSLT